MSTNETAACVPTPQPCLLFRLSNKEITDTFLILEKKVMFPIQDAILVLFAAFFVFNTNYPMGCTNVFTALECIFLDKPVMGRKLRVSAFMSRLSMIDATT